MLADQNGNMERLGAGRPVGEELAATAVLGVVAAKDFAT
jgi:hypothetical protein